jgi:hypothetical protein
MKSIIKIAFVMVVVMVFAGCGKNPLISTYSSTASGGNAGADGGGSGAGSVGAAMSVTTAQLSVSMMPQIFTEAVTPTAYDGGWVTFDWGEYVKIACYNASGVLIAPATLSEWNTANADTKTMRVIASKWGAVFDATFTLNVLGNLDFSGGGSMAGTLKYTLGDRVFACTYSNFSMTAGGVFSGTVTALMGSWRVALTFNSNGSVDGTITGPEYTATIHVDQNGTGSYTDSTGTHTIS